MFRPMFSLVSFFRETNVLEYSRLSKSFFFDDSMPVTIPFPLETPTTDLAACEALETTFFLQYTFQKKDVKTPEQKEKREKQQPTNLG